MKDDLSPAERPPAGDGQQLTHIFSRKLGKQRPLHAMKSV